MEIHSSSLASRPIKAGVSTPAKISRVENNVANDDAKASAEHKVIESVSTPQEIEQVLSKPVLRISNELMVNDAVYKPKNIRVQHALNAYDGQRSQPIKNQRAELITGIDFYA